MSRTLRTVVPLRSTLSALAGTLMVAALPAAAADLEAEGLEPSVLDTGAAWDELHLESLPDSPYVVGGDQAALGDWPDTAGIVFGGRYVGCTGTLVAPDVVLTAAHCVGGISHVVLDVNNWIDAFEGDGEVIPVIDEIPSRQGDIAVLLLEQRAKTPYRTIARDCIIDDHLKKKSPVWVVGYGATTPEGGGQTSALNAGETTVQTRDCDTNWVGDVFTGCQIPGGEIGAGGNGVDACFGDSGGPLYLPTDEGTYLIGVTSRAYAGVPGNAPCAYGGIYVRPDYFIDWIEEVVGKRMPYPPCNDEFTAEIKPITTAPGKSGSTTPQVDDPDGDRFTVKLREEPVHGTVEITGEGEIVYTADEGYTGEDSFTVRILDDGSSEYPDAPKNRVDITVPVAITACGCATGPGGVPAGAWLLGLVAAFGLRRRR